MIDRADTETTLYRVAICAFTYYPGKVDSEPGYTIDEDLDWCTAPFHGLPPDIVAELRNTMRTMITDSTADRRGFIAALAALADEQSTWRL